MNRIFLSVLFAGCLSNLYAQYDSTEILNRFSQWNTTAIVSGGRIDAIRQLEGSTILCGTRGKNKGELWISYNNGLQWKLLAKPTASEITCIAETGNAKEFYILSGNAEVFGTTDGGHTWTHLKTLTANKNKGYYTASYAIMYTSNGTLLVTDTNSEGGHIYRSADKGKTWNDLGAVSQNALYRLEKVGNGIVVNGWAGAIYKSTDDGITWNKMQQLTDTALFATEYLGVSKVLQADQAGDLYYSGNLGYTWEKTGNLKDAADDFINIGYGAVYYSTYTGKKEVYLSLNYGKKWQSLGKLPTEENDWLDHGISVETKDSIIILAGTNKGFIVRNAISKSWLYHTTNKGKAKLDGITSAAVFPVSKVLKGHLFSEQLNETEDILTHNGYAYIPCRDGNNVAIIDYRNPAKPLLVKSLRDIDILDAFSVAIKGDYLYVLSMTNCRLSVFDIKNPARPVKITAISVGSEGSYLYTYQSNYTRLRKICIDGNYAYITHSSESKVYILDISKPNRPAIVSSFHTGDGAFAVLAKGNALFLAGYGPGSSVIAVDVTDKTKPVIKSRIYDSVLLKGTCALHLVKNKLLVTAYHAGTVWILNVGDSLRLTADAYLSHPGMRGPGRITVKGNTAYVINSGNDSMAAIDISDPANPQVRYFIQDPMLKLVYGIAIDNKVLLLTGRDSKTFAVLDLPALEQLADRKSPGSN